MREINDGGVEDMHLNVKRLVGHGPESTTAVLRKDIELPDLTGTNIDDIKALHETMREVLSVLKGEN